jgi:hypothetical protein
MLLALFINGDTFEDKEVGVAWLERAGPENGIGHLILIDAILDDIDVEIDKTSHLDGATEGNLAISL